MGGLIPQPHLEERNPLWRIVVIGIALVVAVVGVIALVTKEAKPKGPPAPDPYAASLQLSDLKMSEATNFVGAKVMYVDGKLTNSGTKTVTDALTEVIFRNSLNEVAQREELQMHVLRTTGPYQEAVDLSVAPLAPGQSAEFRLTFEHVTADWNQAYPELKILQVKTR